MKKELQKSAAELKERLDRLVNKLSLPQKKKRILVLEKEVAKPNLWDNREKAERLFPENTKWIEFTQLDEKTRKIIIEE